jgi:hypothetical protein
LVELLTKESLRGSAQSVVVAAQAFDFLAGQGKIRAQAGYAGRATIPCLWRLFSLLTYGCLNLFANAFRVDEPTR